jgi:hypothetical protein
MTTSSRAKLGRYQDVALTKFKRSAVPFALAAQRLLLHVHLHGFAVVQILQRHFVRDDGVLSLPLPPSGPRSKRERSIAKELCKNVRGVHAMHTATTSQSINTPVVVSFS